MTGKKKKNLEQVIREIKRQTRPGVNLLLKKKSVLFWKG